MSLGFKRLNAYNRDSEIYCSYQTFVSLKAINYFVACIN